MIVVPFTQNFRYRNPDGAPSALVAGLRATPDDHLVLAMDEYDRRPPVDLPDALGTEEALTRLWRDWQNVDEVATPDGGPSLQTCDVAMVVRDGVLSWWIWTPRGLAETMAPGDARRRVRRRR